MGRSTRNRYLRAISQLSEIVVERTAEETISATYGSGVHGMCACMCLPGDKLSACALPANSGQSVARSNGRPPQPQTPKVLDPDGGSSQIANANFPGQQPRGNDQVCRPPQQVALKASAALVCSDASQVACGRGLVSKQGGAQKVAGIMRCEELLGLRLES